MPDLKPYLAVSSYIDWDHPEVLAQARALAGPGDDPLRVARRSFEFVRDRIRHSGDFQCNPVTCRASDVLHHATGFCYAKSHLLAALLRANGIPAGLCYQRLTIDGSGPPFCLHGLNAVWLPEHGWYRLDPRGNKPGVAAEFCPPVEKLAFSLTQSGEANLAEIWAEPLPVVVDALTKYTNYEEVMRNFPDVEID